MRSKKAKKLLGLILAFILLVGMMPELGLRAEAAPAYDLSALIPSKEDSTDALEGKKVSFNGYKWYVTAYDSAAHSATLFSAEYIGVSKFNNTIDEGHDYADSVVKGYLDKLTEADGTFADVKRAIRSADLPDVSVSGSKLYLLSHDEATALPKNVLKCADCESPYATDAGWLRSGAEMEGFVNEDNAMAIDTTEGEVSAWGVPVGAALGVRPALQLELNAVSFDESSRSFVLGGHEHEFTYSASGSTISASCAAADCALDGGKVSLRITAPVRTTALAGLEGLEDFNYATEKNISVSDIEYYKGTEKLEAAPTENGSYTAKLTVEGQTASLDYEISAPRSFDFATLIPEAADDDVALAAKEIRFHGVKWYVTGYDNVNNTVTLLSAECLGVSAFNPTEAAGNAYGSSAVKAFLDGFTAEGGAFSDAAAAINTVCKDGVSGKLYLPSYQEMKELPAKLRECKKASGAEYNYSWLRTPYVSSNSTDNNGKYVKGMDNESGNILPACHVYSVLGVRPALELKADAVSFNPEGRVFTLAGAHAHEFSYATDGAVITATCTREGCALSESKAVLTLKAPLRIQADGSEKAEASLEGVYAFYLATGQAVFETDITYTGRGDSIYEESHTAPVTAGTYTAKISAGGAVASLDYTIGAGNGVSGYDFSTLLPAEGDDAGVAAEKRISFNGTDWYVISYDAASASVTLYSAENIGLSRFNEDINRLAYYKGSTVEAYLSSLTEEGASFAGVAPAIRNASLSDVGVSNAKLFLPSTEEVLFLYDAPEYCICEKPEGIWANFSWLRTDGMDMDRAAFVEGEINLGVILPNGNYIDYIQGVRPSLQLDLNSVQYSPEKHTIFVASPHTHAFTYSAEADTITASCSAEGCSLPEAKISLRICAPSAASVNATLSGLKAFNAATGKTITENDIVYSGRGDTVYAESTVAPTEAGSYKASITVEDRTASVDYELNGQPQQPDEEAWNLFENSSLHTYKLSGISNSTVITNSNAASAAFYEASLSEGVVSVSLKAGTDRKKAASKNNSVLSFVLENGSSVDYILPVVYEVPVLKLSSSSAKINAGVDTPLETTILVKKGGIYEPLDFEGVTVNYNGTAAEISEKGRVRIRVSAAGRGVFSITKEGWEKALELSFTVKAGRKDVLSVDLGGAKSVVLNTNAKAQSFHFPVTLNGEAAGDLKLSDKKNSGIASYEAGILTIACPEGAKAGTYTIVLSNDSASCKVKVKVSNKALENAVTLKIKSSYDVVTKEAMIIEPLLKDVNGSITDVSIENEGFSAELDENGRILVSYDGSAYKVNNLKIGTLNFRLKISGIDKEIPVSIKNVKAKKPKLNVKTVKLNLPKDQDESVTTAVNLLCTYKGSDGRSYELRPVSVKVEKCKNAEAHTDESDPALIRICKLSGKSGSVKVKMYFEGGMEKSLTISVKQAK
ncbi:MAG: hypothetical protein IKO11_00535 [Lachnospiraceae bacterium]|nr:hypothetical protein [Lachnospiraceae bacterium]